MAIKTTKELGEALKQDQDTIEIEGDLARSTFRIKAAGKVAWVVAFGAIVVAVASVLAAPATGGTSASVGLVAAPAAVATIGGAATTAAIGIAVGAGTTAVLGKLRKYKVVKHTKNKLILKR